MDELKQPGQSASSSSSILTKKRLKELLDQVDPTERLEPEVESILLELADDFIGNVTKSACQMAKHRQSDTLEIKDLQLVLESSYGIRLPGFGSLTGASGNAQSEESGGVRVLRKSAVPAAHQTRLAQVRKAVSADLADKEKEKSARKQSRG